MAETVLALSHPFLWQRQGAALPTVETCPDGHASTYPFVIPSSIELPGMTRGLAPSDAMPCFAQQRLTLLIDFPYVLDIYLNDMNYNF